MVLQNINLVKISGSKIDVVCAWVGGASTTPLLNSVVHFAKQKTSNYFLLLQNMKGVFFLSGLLAYSPVRGAFSERTLQFRFTTHAERATSFVLEIGASLVQ